MTRWFRWYIGTSEDGKFRAVARKSRVTVRDALALWAFILEDAADLDHRGVCIRDEDFMAAALDFENGVVETILGAMQDLDMISIGVGAVTINNWGTRQFESDVDSTAADRQARKRTRDKYMCHAPVTPMSRVTQPPQITDTEKNSGSGSARAREALISDEAIRLADLAASLSGACYDMPGWCGAAARVQAWLANGWTEADIVAGVQQAMAKRSSPPDVIHYFEKPIARAFAVRTAPIPIEKAEAGNGRSRQERSGGVVAAARRIEEQFRQAAASPAGDDLAGDPHAVQRLSQG